MAVVILNHQDFREAFPQFLPEIVTDAQLGQAFKTACLLLDNSDASPVPYDPQNGVLARETLLYLLVCHLLTLAGWTAKGQPGPASSMCASTGSLSMSFTTPSGAGSAYFQQTPCGAGYWQALSGFVPGGRYYAAPRLCHPEG